MWWPKDKRLPTWIVVLIVFGTVLAIASPYIVRFLAKLEQTPPPAAAGSGPTDTELLEYVKGINAKVDALVARPAVPQSVAGYDSYGTYDYKESVGPTDYATIRDKELYEVPAWVNVDNSIAEYCFRHNLNKFAQDHPDLEVTAVFPAQPWLGGLRGAYRTFYLMTRPKAGPKQAYVATPLPGGGVQYTFTGSGTVEANGYRVVVNYGGQK